MITVPRLHTSEVWATVLLSFQTCAQMSAEPLAACTLAAKVPSSLLVTAYVHVSEAPDPEGQVDVGVAKLTPL